MIQRLLSGYPTRRARFSELLTGVMSAADERENTIARGSEICELFNFRFNFRFN